MLQPLVSRAVRRTGPIDAVRSLRTIDTIRLSRTSSFRLPRHLPQQIRSRSTLPCSAQYRYLHPYLRPRLHRPIPTQSRHGSVRHQSTLLSTLRTGYEYWREQVKTYLREKPYESRFSFGLFFLFLALVGTYWYQYLVLITPKHNFPEPVAKHLRRALHYSSPVDRQPQKAIEQYEAALELAMEDYGLSPLSNEILGIRFQIMGMYEGSHMYDDAIYVLEQARKSCEEWVAVQGPQPAGEEARKEVARLRGKIVQMSFKLGELYALEHVHDLEAAEESFTRGIEIALSETLRRQKEGEKDGAREGEEEEGQMSMSELGAALERLGHLYEEKNMHNLAAPLFLRAITLAPPPCHAVVLMNNLATSLAQTAPDTSVGVPTSRQALIENARQWAEKAITVSKEVNSPERTEECDVGCAVATHNLGEFAEMEGLFDLAKKRYVEAGSLAKKIGFREGEKNAQEGRERLEKKNK